MAKVKVANSKVDSRRGIEHIGVCAVAVVHDGDGNILLMKRGPKARDEHGKWDIVGGAIEFGESTIDAVHREIAEELCTSPLEVEFLTAYDAHREHNGSRTHWVVLVHAVRVDPESVKIGEPHKIDAVKWFNNDNLPTPRHSQFDKSYAVARAAKIVR